MKLENWSCVKRGYNNTFCLRGEVEDHPKFGHREKIFTSPVIALDKNNNVITLSGSVYELGKVDPEYEKQFPGAKEHFFKTMEGKQHASS